MAELSRFQFWQLYNEGMGLIEVDPDECIRILTRGYEVAVKQNEPEWIVIFDHWRLQALLLYKQDFNTALKLGILGAIEARKPAYQSFQETICIQQDLIIAYQGIDPLGYAELIKEAIDLTYSQTHPAINCYFCLTQSLIDYHLEQENSEAARDLAAKFFAETNQDSYYRTYACDYLCHFSREDERWQDVLSIALMGVESAEDHHWQHHWIQMKCWEMLARQMLGETETARKIHDLLRHKVRNMKQVQGERYYELMIAYHEACGNWVEALRLADEHLRHLVGSGQRYVEVNARLRRMRVLQRMNQPQEIAAEAQRAKDIAQEMKSASILLRRIDTAL